MLSWAFLFLVIVIIAEIFGFSGIAGESAWIAHVLFLIFIVLFIVSFLFRGRPSVKPAKATQKAAECSGVAGEFRCNWGPDLRFKPGLGNSRQASRLFSWQVATTRQLAWARG